MRGGWRTDLCAATAGLSYAGAVRGAGQAGGAAGQPPICRYLAYLRFQAVSPEPNYNVVQLDSNYYRVLPQGTDAPLDQTIFITKDQRLVTHVADEIERWLSDRTHEQPIPATLDATGSWRVHRPLFDGPLEATVLQAFPRLTASSSRFAGRRLIELSDPGRTASATHLLNVRATLDDWLTVREEKLARPTICSGSCDPPN